MPLSSIAKQANGVYTEPGPEPQLLDYDDPDAEGQCIGDDELHSFSCPCWPCKAFNDRLDLLLEANRAKGTEEE